ncbi:Rne/Rng family ribonuclease [Sediminivirga luteola]|nr:Rne/Rng family ribonuclease [Sediminivirga luteola]MCI2264266.1 Rne/Rng family ribonuclease [Sediminivirga luteola]
MERQRQEAAQKALDDEIRAKLDDIASAAESLRTGDERVPAAQAQANRGTEFEGFLRESLDGEDSPEDDEGAAGSAHAPKDRQAREERQASTGGSRQGGSQGSGAAAGDSPAAAAPVLSPFSPFSAPEHHAPQTPAAPVAPGQPFQVPGLFSAAGSEATEENEDVEDGIPARPPVPPVQPSVGLLFQAPDPEQAIVPEDDDYDDYDDEGDEQDAPEEDQEGTGDAGDDQDDDNDDLGDQSRRRRRRGGRGRRRRSRDERDGEPHAAEERQDAEPEAEPAGDRQEESRRKASAGKPDPAGRTETAEAATADAESSQGENDDEQGGSRRRRRRRREATGTDEVQLVKGSTRLEAKRQRRREGREAGRRKQTITEAEFLARRESVDRQMIVRQEGSRTQIAVLEDDVCVEHYMSESSQQASLIGNVYLGKVQNVLPSMEAAFVDIGKGRNAVLYAGEVNWDVLGTKGEPRRIELALSSGDPVLVQVTKDPVGHKGARLTSQISLPGRFLVFVPGSSMTGISRKLPDNERARLKKILKAVVPSGSGVIVRTAAEGASEEDLRQDVERLTKRWESIQKKADSPKVLAPQLLYGEPDMTLRIIRDVFNEDFSALVVQGDKAWKEISEYVESVAPDLVERMSRYDEDEDVFERYRVNEMIARAMNRKVNLPSGGSLVIDRTEAMTVIDVNTGKFTGSGGNLEETVTRNNLEAAEEVIRQLRLRDIGGIIVIDFIDMVLESNRDLVVRRLVECLGRDRTRHQVAEVTSLGLVQMTRKRIGTGLAESFAAAGEDLSGRGLLLPGTENEGGGKQFKSRKERRKDRNNDRNGKDKGQKAEDQSQDDKKPTVEASRQAVAAIAKATIKSEEKDEDKAAGDARDATSQQAPAAPAAPVEEPAADAPLMIGLDATTRIQEAPARKPARRATRAAKKDRPQERPAEEKTAEETTPAPPVLLLGMGDQDT